MIRQINCNSACTYEADVKVKADGTLGMPDTGEMITPPAAGIVAGIKVRIAGRRVNDDGTPAPALHTDLNNLPTTERANKVGRIYTEVSQALQQAHLVPLGEGTEYFVIFSNAGGVDCDYIHCRVACATEIA